MLSKKPAILLSSYTSFPSLCYTSPKPGTSCRTSRPQTRGYAQHASDPADFPTHNEEAELLRWPDPVHPHQTPTPYQILAVRKGEAYTKHRFYSLAKLYHPDRCHPSSPVAHLSPAVRLERYRLLVAAHAILADEEKRRAYDAWGHGWGGHHQTPSYQSTHDRSSGHTRWPSDHNPLNNATWEDWERWYDREYQRQRYEAPRTVYMSNFGFVSLIFGIVTIGGILQGTRANMMTTSAMEQREKIHKEASRELGRSQRATNMSGDPRERIKTFLEHREANINGADAYQRILPEAETCSPDTVRKQ